MEKYGIDMSVADELEKSGLTKEAARVAAANGTGEGLLKEAMLKKKKAVPNGDGHKQDPKEREGKVG